MKKLLLQLLALLLAGPAFLLACGFGLPAQYDESFLGELSDKCALLEQSPAPRIVLVGGSSLAFGVDSALLEQEFPGYTVVNFGLYAALGTQLMLELSDGQFREGDIVILSPEQQAQTLSCYFNAEAAWQALDGDFALLARLDPSHFGALLGQYPYFAARKLNYFLQGEKPVPEGVYRHASFDSRGDVRADTPANIMPGGWDRNTPVLLEPQVTDPDFVALVNGWAARAAEQGAQVYYRLCPMNAEAVQGDPDAYYDYLRGKLDFPILGDPKACILDPAWFYDTNFHLNEAGRQLNTRTLARDLKAQLGDTSKTDIPIPAMPELAAVETARGDDSDTACFTFEQQGSAAVLTGVTAEGRSRGTLTVPTHWQGLPVTAIADGAFAGCGALRAIRLQSSDPTACIPGQGLLEGCAADVSILVPEGSADAYKLSYFWSGYAAHIR